MNLFSDNRNKYIEYFWYFIFIIFYSQIDISDATFEMNISSGRMDQFNIWYGNPILIKVFLIIATIM